MDQRFGEEISGARDSNDGVTRVSEEVDDGGGSDRFCR